MIKKRKTPPKHDQMYDHDQNDHFEGKKLMSCRVVSEKTRPTTTRSPFWSWSVPTLGPDKRINDQIVKILSFDIEIVYDKGESTQIDLANFISRTEYLQKPCTSSCRICVDKQDAIGESYKKTLELLTSKHSQASVLIILKTYLRQSMRKCSGGTRGT